MDFCVVRERSPQKEGRKEESNKRKLESFLTLDEGGRKKEDLPGFVWRLLHNFFS